MKSAAAIASIVRGIGINVEAVSELDDVQDGCVLMNGWHLSVGVNYLIPVRHTGDGKFMFYPEVKSASKAKIQAIVAQMEKACGR